MERQLEKDLHEDQRDVMYEKRLNQYQRNCPYVQEGQHLQNAIDFLKKYRKQSFENEDGWDYTDTDGNLEECTKGNSRPSKSPCQSTMGSKGNKVSPPQAQISHQWLQTGACTLSYCRFQHFNPQAVYPNLSTSFNPNINKQNTIRNDSKWTMDTNDRRTKLCFQFRDLGYCTYGRMCKFTHNSHSDSHIPMHVSAYKRKHYSDFNKSSICFNF